MFDFESTFGHYVKNPSLLPILRDSVTTWVGAPQLKKLCSKLRKVLTWRRDGYTCFVLADCNSFSTMELNIWSFPSQAWISSGRHSMDVGLDCGPFTGGFHFL